MRSCARTSGPRSRRSPSDRRRALVVQRTGLGQVGRLLRGHPPAAGRGGGADGDRQPAARPHAQPDRRGRACRHPGGHHQLHQHRGLGADPGPDPCGGGRRPAGEPGAAQQPGLPRRGAAQAGGYLRPAGRRRGALHLRLGPRLPARLPADPHAARRPARGHPGAGHDGDRQRAGHRRRGRAAGPRRRGPARQPRPRVPAPRRGQAQDRPAAAGLARRPPRGAAGLRHRLLPHRGRHAGDRRLPAVAGARGRGLLRPDRDHRAPGAGAGPHRRPGQGADRHERAGHGLRRDPRLRGQHGRTAVPGRLLPAGRARRAWSRGRGQRDRRAAAGARGPRHLGLLRLAVLPA